MIGSLVHSTPLGCRIDEWEGLTAPFTIANFALGQSMGDLVDGGSPCPSCGRVVTCWSRLMI